jgi:hypothetical protein
MDIVLQQQFEKLVDGRMTFTSHNLGFNLLISRLKKNYTSNQTPSEMSSCIHEIDAFCSKYSSILVGELEDIKKL